MQKHERTGKRLLALVLALVMALSTVTECLAAVTSVQRPVDEADVTMGKLLAEAYSGSLTDSEKALLKSGYLAGDEAYVFTPPAADNSNGLVTIDKDSRKVTASSYKDGELMWTPVEAAVIVAGTTVENVQLVESSNSGVYTGVVTTNETSYSVAVKYRMYITVDQSVQNTMLGAGKDLKDAVEAVVSAAEGANCLEELLLTKVTMSLECVQDNKDPKQNQQEHYFYEVLAKLNKQDGGGILFSRNSSEKMDLEVYCGLTQSEGELLKKITDDVKDNRLQISEKIGSFTQSGGIRNLLGLRGSAVQTEIAEAAAEARTQIEIIGKTQNLIIIAASSAAWNAVKANLTAADTGLQQFENFDHNVVNDLVSTDLTADEGAQLDALVNAVSSADAGKAAATGADLLANETLVTANVAQATVKVVFKADVFDKGATTTRTLSSAEYEMRVDAGKTESDIEAELSQKNWTDEVLNGWNTENAGFSYNVSEAYYDCNVSVTPEVGAAGLEDGKTYTYTVMYTPKTYTVTAADCDDIAGGQFGYGYTLTLPKLESENQVYDYTVNDESYDQGTQYRVTGPTTITRKVGKAWESHDLGELFAKNYAPNDTHVEKILKSVALKSGSIRLRTPSDDNDLLSIAAGGTGYVVTAKPYNANTEGRQWKPVTAIPVTDGVNGAPVFFAESNGVYTASLSGSFDSALVQYELELNWTDFGSGYTAADAEDIVNLPDKLAAEAKQQLHGMDTLAGQSDNLKLLNENLGFIKSVIVDDTDKGVSQAAKDAMQYVYDRCAESVDGNRRMIVYPYVMDYKECATNGAKLAYYYQNNSELRMRVQQLYEKLSIVLSDEGVRRLIRDNSQTAPYYDRLDEIIGKLQDVSTSLLAVDTHIDMGSASLASLTDLITAAIDQTQEYQVNDLPTLATTLRIAAPSKVTVNITASIQNSDGAVLATVSKAVTFDKDAEAETRTLTDTDADKLSQDLKAATNEAATAAGVDVGYYERSETGALPGAGTVVSGTVAYTAVYTPKAYTVKIDDGETLSFYFDKPTVELPAHDTEGFRYEYTVDGQKKRSGEYTFTKDQIDRLFDASNSYTITRVVVDTRDEAIRTYLQDANASTSGDELLNFMALEKNGKVSSVVLRIGVNKELNTKAVEKLGQYLVGKSIGLAIADQEIFNSDDTMLSVNGLVQALLHSGMTLESFRDAINEDGSMKEMAAPSGETVVADVNVKQSDLLGAKLFESTIKFTVSGTGIEMPLYVTMESFDAGKDRVKSIRDGVESVMTYVPVAKAESGAVTLEGSLPEKYWKGVLSALLVTGMADLDNIKDIDTRAVVQYLVGKLDDLLMDGTVDLNTLGNTLIKMGVSADTVSKLTAKNDTYKKVQKYLQFLLDDTKVAWNSAASQGDTYRVTASVDAYTILDELNIEAGTKDLLKSFIKNETVTAEASVKVKNVQESDYAAIVVGSGGVSFLTDLNTTIEKDTSLVVLLKNCGGTLRINGKYVYVDLRGHTFSGDIIGTEQYKANNFVVDSILDTNGGSVTGKVQNMVLAGGSYDESKLAGCEIRNGYTMENGLVSNQYYTIAVNGSNINVTLKATAQSLRDADKYTVAALAGDLASDLLLNYYSTAQKVTVDGHTLYNAAVEDITTLFQNGKFHVSNAVGNDLLDDILGYTSEGAADNYDGVNYLIGSLLDTLLDFQNLADSIGSSNAAVSYSLATTAWDVTVDKAESGDYLAIGVTGSTDSGKTKRQTLNVFLNSDSEKNNEQLKNALKQLAGIIKVDAANKPSLSLDRITLPQELGGKTVQAKLSGSGHVTVKISDKPVYAALMAITVANSLPAGDSLRAELKNAVETFYNNNDAAALKTAMEKVTCAQVFAALKTVGLRTNFLQMAISVGFGTGSKTYKAISENYDSLTAYRGGMAAAGWLLKQLNINGNGATLAGFETEFGIYKYAPDKTFNKTATVSGDWKVNGVVSLENAKLTLELFAEEGAIVVIDKDGKHTSFAADQLTAAVAKVNEAGGTLRFNDAVTMEADETITKDVVVVNGSKLDQGSYVFLLDGVNSKLTSDAALTVKSSDGAFRLVTDNTTAGKYIYTLEAYKVRYVKDGNAAYDDSLTVAVTNADEGTTITVLEDVTARGEIEVSKSLTIAGAGKITGDPTFKLTGAAGTVLTADAALTVISGDEAAYYVNAVSNGAEYTYTLTAWEVVLEKADGSKTGYHDLAAAMTDAVDGDTITVNSSVKMTGDISINSAKTLTIKGAGLIDQNGYAFILGDKDAKLVADSSSLTVKTTVAGDYELNKVTQNGMTTYKLTAWEIMLVKADGSKTGYHDLAAAVADAVTGDTIVVNSSVHVSGEIGVSASLTITGADKITGAPTFKLTGAAGTALTADAALTVKSGNETAYYVNATSDGTKHTYTLTAWEVVLTKANGSKTGYHDLVAAMADAATGDTIVVNSSVHVSGEIGVSVSLTITGADKIIGDPTFKLTGAAGTALTVDAALTVKSGDETAYYINATSDGTKHTYTLTAWEITLEKADGSKVGYHDLAAAAADAGTDDTIVVNSSVKMAGDISINSAKTLTIKGAGLIDQNGHAFNLGHKDAKLVADSASLTVKITVAGSYELSKVTQNGMTTYALTVPTVWEITLEKADGSKVGYHDLAAAAADAKTGDTVIVNSSVKMADDIDINNARTLTIKGAGLIDQNGHAFNLGNKDAKLVADSSNLTVKITVAGSYELSKVTQNGMTTYSLTVPTVWEITLEKADGSKVGYHDLAAAAADAKTGDTVVVNSSVKMAGDISINSAKTLTIEGAGLIDQNGHAFNLGHKDAKLVADANSLTVKVTMAGGYTLNKVTQNGMTTYSLIAPTVWEITLEKADGSKVGYHDLAAAAADAETGDTVIVNSSVKMTSNISISSAKTLTIKGAGLIDQNGHAFELGHKSARLVADSDSLFVKVTVAGSYEVGKVSQGEMTAYIVKAKSSDDDDDHGGGGGGGGYTGNYIYLDVQPSGINAKQLQTAVRKYFGDSSAEVTVNSGLTASGLVANGASIYVSGSRAGSYTVIIMGDTNCNGKTDSGDAVKMRNHYFGTAQLTGAALEAADMNRNGKVDSGDAVKNRVKYQNWGGYSSTLKITV